MSKEEKKNLYEGMYILSAQLSDEARGRALQNLKNLVTEFGGEIKHVIEMGRRRLEYDVNGHREGYYFLMYFDVVPSAITTLWREYQLNEDLVRFMTLRTDKVLEEINFKSLVEQA